ncbi:MAG: S-adenosylmethionine:tRNA ribosyltransferase-isomerase [Nitrospirae bacterium]|nr:S-adenosylmethionine:tRNA ribosyltransferase-isomerase [Nitrospirota bacterium]MCL5236249.1 S-adenosylmethionine:tRNA ribosyltransferase-isomerase [Nitrospirota bacterium]
MRTADFDFSLPKELIAARPSGKRDHSRLLVLHRDGGIEHRIFTDIGEYLNKGDMLLLNNTKVFPARIIGAKPSGGKVDILLIKALDNNGTWEVLCKGGFNGVLTVFGGLKAEIRTEDSHSSLPSDSLRIAHHASRGRRLLRFLDVGQHVLADMLWRYGYMPLPPYIKRKPDEEDKSRYQTVYAERQGSIAAPTAGLHFTGELLGRIREKGIIVRTVTLHVGIGTFKPVKAESLDEHRMDPEYFEIESSLMEEIEDVKRKGNRLVAVGTTATRTLEGFMSGRYKDSEALSVMRNELTDKDKEPLDASRITGKRRGLALFTNSRWFTTDEVKRSRRMGTVPGGLIKGYTDIFIYPGYKFKAVDSLITNFHLPRSTPLMLATSFSGFQKISRAYEEAVALNYRFFSYGDAMLIL